MKEDLLHYLWKFRKFNGTALRTIDGKTLQLIDPGQHNYDSGPDFFNGKIRIGRQTWAGNIELHLKSSDWYQHGHQKDQAYDNVILHVVWRFDRVVKRHDGTNIPTLELRHYVNKRLLERYNQLAMSYLSWIPCENDLARVGRLTIANMLESCYLERLEQKTNIVLKELKRLKGDWEALLFRKLSRAFGAKVNGDALESMASSVPFSLVRKYSYDSEALEALLMGQAGLLSGQAADGHSIKMKEIYGFLKIKHKLDQKHVTSPKFFRIRPSGFPTIRLSQLSALYASRKKLFALLTEASTLEEYYSIFDIQASRYWETHYRFGTVVKKSARRLSRSFIDHILINTVVPVKFAYESSTGIPDWEKLSELVSGLKPESNAVVRRFAELGLKAENAFESQALLQLKGAYCEKNKCLQCKVGSALLSGKAVASSANRIGLPVAE